jgi:sarcosine oxidase subunit gamma
VSEAWQPRDASHGVIVPGRYGRGGEPGVRVLRRAGLRLATIIAGKGRGEELARALQELAGIVPPAAPKAVHGIMSLVWSGPDQWLMVADRADAVEAAARKLAGLAAITDQSDARAVLRLSGAHIRDVLAKGCPIDLHPRVFKTGDAAVTVIAHIGVQLWQIDDQPGYDLIVSRSMVSSFWSWFDASAAEFGYAVE